MSDARSRPRSRLGLQHPTVVPANYEADRTTTDDR